MRRPTLLRLGRLSIAALVVWLLIPAPSGAQPAQFEPPPATTPLATLPDAGAVEMQGILAAQVGTGHLLTLPVDVERVALADDRIARVQIISPREVLLTGLVPGRTTLHVWLVDGQRIRHFLQVERDLELVRRTLGELDPRIRVEASNDGTSVVLYGEVVDSSMALSARARAAAILEASAGGGAEILDLLRYPGQNYTLEGVLQDLLREIDPRITVRRIQVGGLPDSEADTFVLEGQVKGVQALVRAITLAERQLGGTGGRVSAVETDRVTNDRFRGFFGSTGSGGGGQGGTSLRGSDPRSSSLSSQLARGLVVTSESGRVVSLLEVDELPQVMVSIRVLEVDRAKARRVGFDFRFSNDKVSIGNYTIPGGRTATSVGIDQLPGVSSAANIIGAFVDQTSEILAAIDFMAEKELARAVAEPNVVTLSGELASIVVGGEVPIPTTSVNQVTAVQGFFFQDFGVRLDIRPTVTGDDMIALEVAPSIVRVAPGLSVGGVPGFQVQSVSTTSRVRAGQSLLIGGLLSFEEGLEERRVPGLGVIPLFRWKRRSREERELLFLITPRLVDTESAPQIEPVVQPPDPRDVVLPELEWPLGRGSFAGAEPEPVRPDGAPAEFVADAYVWEEYDAGAEPEEEISFTVEPEPAEPEVTVEPLVEEVIVFQPYYARIMADPCLRLRAQPSTEAAILDCIPPDTWVEVHALEIDWAWVRLPEDGREGWMAHVWLEPAAAEGESDGSEASARREMPVGFESEVGVLGEGTGGTASAASGGLDEQIARAEAGQGELEQQLERIRTELQRVRGESADDSPD